MKFADRWPPVPAGILIGISMLLAFAVAGRGIGASGAMTRFVAWVQHGLFPVAAEPNCPENNTKTSRQILRGNCCGMFDIL